MTTKTGIEELISRQVAAWNRRDAAEIAACYEEDAVVTDPSYDSPLRGRAAIEKDAADFFAAFPDMAARLVRFVDKGNLAAVEGVGSGTHKGPLTLPTGVVPATDRRVEFPICYVIELGPSGLIREEHRYYDVAGMLAQLGLLQ